MVASGGPCFFGGANASQGKGRMPFTPGPAFEESRGALYLSLSGIAITSQSFLGFSYERVLKQSQWPCPDRFLVVIWGLYRRYMWIMEKENGKYYIYIYIYIHTYR